MERRWIWISTTHASEGTDKIGLHLAKIVALKLARRRKRKVCEGQGGEARKEREKGRQQGRHCIWLLNAGW